jgi:toxin ParE1/3/4
MNRRIVVRPEAESEFVEAAEWYEARSPGLGAEFLRALDATIAGIERNRFVQATVFGEVRRALMRRFPYGVFYTVTDT